MHDIVKYHINILCPRYMQVCISAHTSDVILFLCHIYFCMCISKSCIAFPSNILEVPEFQQLVLILEPGLQARFLRPKLCHPKSFKVVVYCMSLFGCYCAMGHPLLMKVVVDQILAKMKREDEDEDNLSYAYIFSLFSTAHVFKQFLTENVWYNFN